MGYCRCYTTRYAPKKSTLNAGRTTRRSALIITTEGAGIASHAGSAALTELGDRLGWTAALSTGMVSRPIRRHRLHQPVFR